MGESLDIFRIDLVAAFCSGQSSDRMMIVMMMIAIARYLIRETDEYVRNLVIQSILWGFGLVMVADTILGYLIAYQSIHLRSFGVFNMDIFVVTAGIALRIQLWRNR